MYVGSQVVEWLIQELKNCVIAYPSKGDIAKLRAQCLANVRWTRKDIGNGAMPLVKGYITKSPEGIDELKHNYIPGETWK